MPTNQRGTSSPHGDDDAPLNQSDTDLSQRGDGLVPLVGLGGSAGSIPALQEFFEAIPADSGFAFVVVVHLSPLHESTLPAMLQRHTAMAVAVAVDGASIEPNSVHVIPPGKFVSISDGLLRVTEAQQPRGQRVTVDVFFRALAESHGNAAMAIILSGAGSDGALGLKRIRELGGLTVAQTPDQAEHPDMPRAAIATGTVDWVLGVNDMPQQLLSYAQHRVTLQLKEDDRRAVTAPADDAADEQLTALRDILAFLHTRTGRDFSYYKRATILRRIARRMQVNGVLDLPTYRGYLRTHAGEAAALLSDMLISVTNFFRDPPAFAALERIIPDLFVGKDASDTVRVWVAGCATGEEAYSMAILLMEHANRLVGAPQLQIFATDLDEDVIREARDGFYPESIAMDVSEERLRHFFIHERGGYRVRRAVREIVLFAPHDVLNDSPFSRLDLVSCRNLLIYLNRPAQDRVFEIFHFALIGTGRLFLGTSEAVEDGSALFSEIDKKHRLYARRPSPRRVIDLPTGPTTLSRALALQERTHARQIPPRTLDAARRLALRVEDSEKTPEPFLAVDLHYHLIQRFAPPSVLVNAAHEIVHLSESVGKFLRLGGGEPTRDLLHLVHPMLRIELRAALFSAAQSHSPASAHNVLVETDEWRNLVDIHVTPADDLAADFVLVVFEEHGAAEESLAATTSPRPDSDAAALHLERELVATKAQLRSTIEESQASTEELKASNEELQAMNEELRSATEELETGREELQSINEELTTVNDELKTSLDQLFVSNNDLQNLIAATQIATVFLDRDLRITRFTPSAKALFNVIPSDVGRPLADLSRLIEYPELVADARSALAHLQAAERDVSTGERHYIARTFPYRTADDRIAGVVLTFLDITEQKRAEARLRASERRQSFLVTLSDALRPLADPTAVKTQASRLLGKALGANRVVYFDVVGEDYVIEVDYSVGVQSLTGRYPIASYGDALLSAFRAGMTVVESDAVSEAGRSAGEREAFASIDVRGHVDVPLVKNGLFVAGMTVHVSDRRDWSENEVALIEDTAERTWASVERVRAESALQLSEERSAFVRKSSGVGFWYCDLPFDVLQWDDLVKTHFQLPHDAHVTIETFYDRLHPDDREPTRQAIAASITDRTPYNVEYRSVHPDTGTVKYVRAVGRTFYADDGTPLRFDGVTFDISEQKRAEERVRDADRRKDEFLATLAHELRNPLAPIRNGLAVLRFAGATGIIEQTRAMMERQLSQLVRLVDDLLDVRRLTSDKFELRLETIEIRDVIDAAVETARPAIETAGHTLAIAMPDDPILLEGDATRLAQVVSNLLLNSAKYMNKGGSIRLGVDRDGDLVVVTVADDGIGIPTAMLDKVFDMFAQVDRTLEKTTGGLGIGLSLVKGLVEMHGGRVTARSEGEGRGSEFEVRLPAL